MSVEAAAELAGVSSAVIAGVDEVRDQFSGHTVTVSPDGSGGVFVVVDDVPTGGPYVEPTTWLGFHINAAYPASDVYPHFVSRLHRRDQKPHGDGIQEVTWQDRSALQLSRRSNRWNGAIDTAALKAMKVLAWLRSR